MSIFEASEQAYAVFGSLFRILIQDQDFNQKLEHANLDVRLIHTKPDCVLYIAPGLVAEGDEAPEEAAIQIKMSCDTAHKLWCGELLMPAALATGRVRIKGKVAKVLELVPILQPAFDRYSDIAAEHGITS